MTIHAISDQDIARALDAGRDEAETEFRARSVRYLADRDVVEIVTTRDAGFLIPRAWIGALADLTSAQLAQLQVWLDGSAIELDALDIQLSVHGLLTQALPAMLPARVLAGLFASRGGKATSGVKKRTAQENGRKGGRPRKQTSPNAA
jgi:hypothetical protein